ncbi:MAG: transcriptional repressor [Candidatus Saganbacteria bacterium]|nr:transcriptional repressor [Candidatus Saganbacteria bacterium]
MKSLQERFEDKGIRPSQQRLRIMKYLEGRHDHPSVDMIYDALVREMPTISKTTIYNTLRLMVEKALVADLTISGQGVRYDPVTEPHSHFLCRKCGQVIDLEDIECPCLKKEVQGNKVEEVRVYLIGLCKKCHRR